MTYNVRVCVSAMVLSTAIVYIYIYIYVCMYVCMYVYINTS
jgi:hypothetical protein